MQRRKFVIGLGATASGGAAALGTGAFSRVESQRQVSIQVATDANAYLGMVPMDTPNSNNYVSTDGDGHLTIDVGEHDDFDGPDTQPGQGVNSDSFTWFDGMFQLCNQGKADAEISYELPDPPADRDFGGNWTAPEEGYDEQVVAFYYMNDDGERIIVTDDDTVPLPVGECEEIGLRTVTKGVDATTEAPLIDGEVVVTADAPGAGEPVGGGDDGDGNGTDMS